MMPPIYTHAIAKNAVNPSFPPIIRLCLFLQPTNSFTGRANFIRNSLLKPFKPFESENPANPFVETNSKSLCACFELCFSEIFGGRLCGGFAKYREQPPCQ